MKKLTFKKQIISILCIAGYINSASLTQALTRDFNPGLKNIYKVTYQSNAPTDLGLSFEKGTLSETITEVKDNNVKISYDYVIKKLEHNTEPQEIPTQFTEDRIVLKNNSIEEMYVGSTFLPYFLNIFYEAFQKYNETAKKEIDFETIKTFTVSVLDYYDLMITPKQLLKTSTMPKNLSLNFNFESCTTDHNGTRTHLSFTVNNRKWTGISRGRGTIVFGPDGFINKVICEFPNVISVMKLSGILQDGLLEKKQTDKEHPVKLIIERIDSKVPEQQLATVTNDDKSKESIPTIKEEEKAQHSTLPNPNTNKETKTSKIQEPIASDSNPNVTQSANTSTNSSNSSKRVNKGRFVPNNKNKQTKFK